MTLMCGQPYVSKYSSSMAWGRFIPNCMHRCSSLHLLFPVLRFFKQIPPSTERPGSSNTHVSAPKNEHCKILKHEGPEHVHIIIQIDIQITVESRENSHTTIGKRQTSRRQYRSDLWTSHEKFPCLGTRTQRIEATWRREECPAHLVGTKTKKNVLTRKG